MPSNLANTSLADAWNNNYMKGTRKAMMRGEKPASCIKCFKDIDTSSIREELQNLNISRDKITHLVDWFKAIYLQTDPKYIIKELK